MSDPLFGKYELPISNSILTSIRLPCIFTGFKRLHLISSSSSLDVCAMRGKASQLRFRHDQF